MALTPMQRRIRDLTERDFQRKYVRCLRELGFHVGHHYDSRFSDPGTKGMPDLLVVGHGAFWMEELKREKGIVSPEQHEWHNELRVAGINIYVSRPSDWSLMLLRAETIARQSLPDELRAFPA